MRHRRLRCCTRSPGGDLQSGDSGPWPEDGVKWLNRAHGLCSHGGSHKSCSSRFFSRLHRCFSQTASIQEVTLNSNKNNTREGLSEHAAADAGRWEVGGGSASLDVRRQRQDIDTDIIYVNGGGGGSAILRPAEFKVSAETLCFFFSIPGINEKFG